MKLSCTAPLQWYWWDQGVFFAEGPLVRQHVILADKIDLSHLPGNHLAATTSVENWSTLQKLCEITLLGPSTESKRDPIRRAARLVEIANKIRQNPSLSVPQLHYLFWEKGLTTTAPETAQCHRADAEDGLEQINAALTLPPGASLPIYDTKLSVRQFVDWAWEKSELGSLLDGVAGTLGKASVIEKLEDRLGDINKTLSHSEMLGILTKIPEDKLDQEKRVKVQKLIDQA
ncbi:MAG: hypothetical protein IT576_15630, partial [Verrucomicrobiales bacterium]|nr:hypothetical protein [Verrucomicrobiales bacterium]